VTRVRTIESAWSGKSKADRIGDHRLRPGALAVTGPQGPMGASGHPAEPRKPLSFPSSVHSLLRSRDVGGRATGPDGALVAISQADAALTKEPA